MTFRNATTEDLNKIMVIIRKAQQYLREKGVDQWQGNYPNEDIIRADINKNIGYILEKDNDIIATVAVSFNDEKTYDKIYNGSWITNNEYAVIHRIAVDNKYKGKRVSSLIIAKVEDMCISKGIRSIKVDTHRKNESMQKMLSYNGFKYCGIIYLEDGSERFAYEKVI
ncbi:MAG: GNAT family N-acetyltransferase [Acetivibrionales bacterium]